MKPNPFPRGSVCWCGLELLSAAVLLALIVTLFTWLGVVTP